MRFYLGVPYWISDTVLLTCLDFAPPGSRGKRAISSQRLLFSSETTPFQAGIRLQLFNLLKTDGKVKDGGHLKAMIFTHLTFLSRNSKQGDDRTCI
jgi:hypothetical protein